VTKKAHGEEGAEKGTESLDPLRLKRAELWSIVSRVSLGVAPPRQERKAKGSTRRAVKGVKARLVCDAQKMIRLSGVNETGPRGHELEFSGMCRMRVHFRYFVGPLQLGLSIRQFRRPMRRQQGRGCRHERAR